MTIDRESLRPAFERAYPMPESMAWIAPTGTYMSLCADDESLHEAHRYRGRWEGFCAAFESLGEPVALHVDRDGSTTPVYRLPEVTP